jgi:hypothetical protein
MLPHYVRTPVAGHVPQVHLQRLAKNSDCKVLSLAAFTTNTHASLAIFQDELLESHTCSGTRQP